ncbi:MAG: methylated-DNA--[protein]-cysteine S-methyltransferase [Eubacteriales bacterium]|nr:methylated-DNA--[protein]-cysteine S-methyltransferase [Eubacteriales bacterium]
MEYLKDYRSPLGMITMASDGKALTGLWFEEQKYYAATLTGNEERKSLPVFDEVNEWLNCYFTGREPEFTPPLKLKVTPFRREVCEIMLTIPYGKTMTYKEIAEIIAKRRSVERMSAQAVGQAVGHNPISIIVPCHRVIGTDGSLTGYAGGIDKKISLLRLEGHEITAFKLPK